MAQQDRLYNERGPSNIIRAPAGSTPRGYLSVQIEDATGNNRQENFTWDQNKFEAFVRVDLRGAKEAGKESGVKPLKGNTSVRQVKGSTVTWKQRLIFELTDQADELRVMLVRVQGGKRHVIAACGIFIESILGAVPIDKDFDLYKPGSGDEGGSVRLIINFVKDISDLQNNVPDQQPAAQNRGIALDQNNEIFRSDSQPVRKGLIRGLFVTATATALFFLIQKTRNREG